MRPFSKVWIDSAFAGLITLRGKERPNGLAKAGFESLVGVQPFPMPHL